MKPEKVKSRWRRNSEMESSEKSTMPPQPFEDSSLEELSSKNNIANEPCNKELSLYEPLEENLYRFEREKTKRKKEIRRMVCDCPPVSEGEGCQSECLNRLLMIECGSRCINGDACSNKRFQKRCYAKTEPFKTENKGFGLRLLERASKGSFIIEYVGEVLNMQLFKNRVKHYAKRTASHYYFMSLKSGVIIDATHMANLSRFINHSCDPNCETQKWTVNGDLRVGFFAKRDIEAGEELTFDYQFQRYGREAQKCYCSSIKCSGYIGVSKEITVDINSDSKNKHKRATFEEKEKDRERERDKKRERRDVLEDSMLEEEVEKLCLNRGLRSKDDTLMLARLMVRAEDCTSREKLLDIILGTTEMACLRLFLDYHGLSLLWSWMAYLMDANLQAKILKALSMLPVPNKTMLEDSKVYKVVEKWASVYNSDADNTSSASPCEKKEDEKKIDMRERDTYTSDSETDGASCFTFSSQNSDIKICDVPNGANSDNFVNSVSNLEESPAPIDNKASDEESGFMLDERETDNIFRSNSEIANLAKKLIECWKDLKEDFRIPRREFKEDLRKKNDSSFYVNEEKPQEEKKIQVVCNIDEKFNSFQRKKKRNFSEYPRKNLNYNNHPGLSKEEKRSLFAMKMAKRDQRNMYNRNRSTHMHNTNFNECQEAHEFYSTQTLSPPENLYNSYNYANHSNKNLKYLSSHSEHNSFNNFNQNASQPPFSHTLASEPNNIVLNSSFSPQIVKTPEPVFTPPNVFVPPPTRIPLLGLPPPVPQQHQQLNTVASYFQTNSQPPHQQLMCIPPPTPHNTHINAAPMGPVIPVTSSDPLLCNANFQNAENDIYMQSTYGPEKEAYPLYHENGEVLPKEPVKLPANWRTAKDHEGNTYYYHVLNRNVQWTPPECEGTEKDEDERDSGTPTYDEPKPEIKPETHSRRSHKKHSKRKSTTTAPADTSSNKVNSEIAKKIKELFRTKMSSYVVQILNPYRKDDCAVARICSNDDFKHLARKLTHFVMAKELKHCKHVEDLDCTESVKLKARDFIHKYMARYGPLYRKEKCISFVDEKCIE